MLPCIHSFRLVRQNVAGCLDRFVADSQHVVENGAAPDGSAPLDLSKYVHKGIGPRRAVDHRRSLDDEFRNAVDSQLLQRVNGVRDLLFPFVSVQKLEEVRLAGSGLFRHQFFQDIGDHSREPGLVIQRVAIDKVVHVQLVVDRFAHRQPIVLSEVLDQSMGCHRAGGLPVQIEKGNAGLQSSPLEIVPVFLVLPTGSAAPLLDQSLPVGLDEHLVFVVVGF
mmetsp:Transcript_12877/g.36292  ORF Transcript_12877/g.36292 Transcript_12877/m.36292 type:complete len:222 (+) Transcript_12877:2758-3423(+)